MKKLLIILFVAFGHTASAQKNVPDGEFQKIDTAVKERSDIYSFISKREKISSLYVPPDSVAIEGKKATMFWFDENLKTTLSKKLCDAYLRIANSDCFVTLRIKLYSSQAKMHRYYDSGPRPAKPADEKVW